MSKNYDEKHDVVYFKDTYVISENKEFQVWRECVCGQSILNLCFIANSDRTQFFICGNCCINHFVNANARTCDICKNKHRNRIINLCNECKTHRKCDICNTEHKNLHHNLCNKCYNKKECKECKLRFNIKDFIPEKNICTLCNSKYCMKCGCLKNTKYQRYLLCYNCKFNMITDTDSKTYPDIIITIERKYKDYSSNENCEKCNKPKNPNYMHFQYCYNCKFNNVKSETEQTINPETNSETINTFQTKFKDYSSNENCEKCNKPKNPKFIKFQYCYKCKFENKSDIKDENKTEIPDKKCIICNTLFKPKASYYNKCYNCFTK